jgi:hypothetical protein
MRAIQEAMKERRFEAIPDQLRSMARHYPQIKGLQKRRHREAALFEKALAERQAR